MHSIYRLENYTFGTKLKHFEKDNSVKARMARWEKNYNQHGIRRVVEGVILVHVHGHPHILLTKIGSSFWKLPGGRLRPHETEGEGLKRKLNSKVAHISPEMQPEWEVGELVCQYWRPNFDQQMYPYCPPHITKPKEVRKMFLVIMPEKCSFAIPSNLNLMAVPLFELFDNNVEYGPVLASLPQMLSRFQFNSI